MVLGRWASLLLLCRIIKDSGSDSWNLGSQMIKWTPVYRQLQTLLDTPGDSYFSGSRFIRVMQDFNAELPDYNEYIDGRRREEKSTTRRDFFKDILKELEEGSRVRAVSALLDELERVDGNAESVSEIRKALGGGTLAPTASIPAEAWNSDRLNAYLTEIDAAIQVAGYERAVTLSYTCLEGFLGAFLRAKVPTDSYPKEIIGLSRSVRDYLKKTIKNYPDEILNLVGHTAYGVDKARNRFSESHFADEAGSWMATYVRDLVNSEIRLLLHFM